MSPKYFEGSIDARAPTLNRMPRNTAYRLTEWMREGFRIGERHEESLFVAEKGGGH